MKGCFAPSRQYLHSPKASLMAKKLTVPHAVILFCWWQFPGEKKSGEKNKVLLI